MCAVRALFEKNDGQDIELIVDKAIEMAEAGDIDAMKIVLDRVAPVRKGALVQFDLPPIKTQADVAAAMGAIVAAVAARLLSTPQQPG